MKKKKKKNATSPSATKARLPNAAPTSALLTFFPFFSFSPFFLKMRLIWALPEVVTNDIKHVGSSAWKLLVEVDCQSGLRSSSSRAVDGVREKNEMKLDSRRWHASSTGRFRMHAYYHHCSSTPDSTFHLLNRSRCAQFFSFLFFFLFSLLFSYYF